MSYEFHDQGGRRSNVNKPQFRPEVDSVRSVAERPGVAALDVEIVCSDAAEQRRRVEPREPDIAGHALPTWQDIVEGAYCASDRDRLVVDSAASDVGACVPAIMGRLSAQA